MKKTAMITGKKSNPSEEKSLISEKQDAFGNSNKILFPKKYRQGLRGYAMIEVLRLREEHPVWQLNDVLAAILKNANPDMPPAFLLELTQHIVAHWEYLESKKLKEHNPVLV